MKKMLSVFLCVCMLLSLAACDREPGGQEPGVELPEVTLPSGSALSGESTVTLPQMGAYAETALLANVPGQQTCLHLSARNDGTVDYIFCSMDEYAVSFGFRSLEDVGLKYYTIAPDGRAVEQPCTWLDQLGQAMDAVVANMPEHYCLWQLEFSSYEGKLLVAAYLRIESGELNGDFPYVALYTVENDQLSQIPVNTTQTVEGAPFTLNWGQTREYYMGEDLFWLFTNDANGNVNTSHRWFAFAYDGTLVKSVASPYELREGGGLWPAVDLRGSGGNLLWAVLFGSWDTFTLLDSASFTPVAQYPKQDDALVRIASICDVTPDGSAYYWFAGNEDDFYKDSCGELCRISEKGMETLIDDSTIYSFGKSIAIPKRMTVDNEGTVYTWAMESGRGVLRQYRPNPEGAAQPRTMTVYSLECNETIRTAVIDWNRSHRDIRFEYVTARERIHGTSQTLEDEMTRLNLEMMTGKGPDVMVLDGMNVDSIIEGGYLYPLDKLDTTGVYDSIVDRFTVDDVLFAMPTKMVPYLMGRRTEDSVAIGSLEEFADFVVNETPAVDGSFDAAYDPVSVMAHPVAYADEVFKLWYPAWSDAIWEDGFQKDVFREFLTQTGRIVTHYQLDTVDYCVEHYSDQMEEENTGMTIVNGWDSENDKTPYVLAAQEYVGLRNLVPRIQFQGESFLINHNVIQPGIPSEITGIPGPDGTGTTVPIGIAGVRDGSEDPQAAVEFIQLLLSDPIQMGTGLTSSYDADGYPVKWSCTPVLLQTMEQEQDRAFDLRNDFRETLSSLRVTVLYEVPYEACLEAACRYYEGVLTADEAADQVEKATEIYMAEQRR